MESDPQLYLFMAVGEYLRITHNYSFLKEEIVLYPREQGQRVTVLEALGRAFVWLRDVVRRGANGLILMRNSDWSDSFFHPYSPNIYNGSAESHLNTAMALAVLPRLAEEIGKSGEHTALAQDLMDELTAYRAQLYMAFMKDMKGRVYAPRCYLGEELRFGEDNLCLEPQPWILLMEDFPEERKRALYAAIREKVLATEKLGARTRERPLWNGSGSGEDGGIWFAHQGPLLMGIASFDRTEARKLLRRLTFRHTAWCYPEYWLGQWTAADSVESTLSEREGLYHFWTEHAFQAFCAHSHAWKLYCYYRLFRE